MVARCFIWPTPPAVLPRSRGSMRWPALPCVGRHWPPATAHLRPRHPRRALPSRLGLRPALNSSPRCFSPHSWLCCEGTTRRKEPSVAASADDARLGQRSSRASPPESHCWAFTWHWRSSNFASHPRRPRWSRGSRAPPRGSHSRFVATLHQSVGSQGLSGTGCTGQANSLAERSGQLLVGRAAHRCLLRRSLATPQSRQQLLVAADLCRLRRAGRALSTPVRKRSAARRRGVHFGRSTCDFRHCSPSW